MRRASRMGLATTAVGLAIVVFGLRSAVAGWSSACTGTGITTTPVPKVTCSGDCPNRDECVVLPTTYVRRPATGFWWVCACLSRGTRIYTPIDAPKCGLVLHAWDEHHDLECVNQRCSAPCGDPQITNVRGGWTCRCAK